MNETKGIRLKVNPQGAELHEEVGATFDEKTKRRIGGRHLSLKPGTVFIHPDAARAKFLLSLRPVVVMETSEKTEAEKAAESDEGKAAANLVNKDLMERAKKIVQAQNAKLAELDGALRKKSPQDLEKEMKTRGIEVDGGNNPEAMVSAILADEKEKMEKAA